MFQVASPNRPLIFLLDALDQLSSSHRAHNLAWLPIFLPSNVHIVVTTLPNRYELKDTLKSKIPQGDNFIGVLPLPSKLSINIVKEWLKRADKTLTPPQFAIVEKALARSPLPLYTCLVFEEVCRWSSYATPDETILEPTIQGVINRLFDRVEKYHGRLLVKHYLSYLTASKNGLNNTELEDILSLDDEVLNDVFQHWLPPVRRIPPLLLPRLQDELSSYVMEREANGTVVIYWYHAQFIEVVRERYLSDEPQGHYTHSLVAHYFLGTWSGGKKKPFKYSQKQLDCTSITRREQEADRMVKKQPLSFGVDPEDSKRLMYNLRKLAELPHHLIASRNFFDLKNQVLFNYEWLYAKLNAMSIHDILGDFQQAIESDDKIRADPDIQLFAAALRVAGAQLNKHPSSLAFDLLSRLLVYYDENEKPMVSHMLVNNVIPAPLTADVGSAKPPSPPTLERRMRRVRHDNIRSMLQQCDSRSLKHSALLPIVQCFDCPTMMSVFILEGHSTSVTDLVFCQSSNELISVSKEQVLFWDRSSGELSRSIDLPDKFIAGRKTLFLSDEEKYLVVDVDGIDAPVLIYDTKSAQLLHTCGSKLPKQRRTFLSGNILCRQKCFIDIKTGKEVSNLSNFVSSKSYAACSLSRDGSLILIGDDAITKLFDFKSKTQLTSFPGKSLPSVLAFSHDCCHAYVGYSSSCLFQVFDINRKSKTFGRATLTFDHRKKLSHEDLSKQRVVNGAEVAEIWISPSNPLILLLNISRVCLITLFLNDGQMRVDGNDKNGIKCDEAAVHIPFHVHW